MIKAFKPKPKQQQQQQQQQQNVEDEPKKLTKMDIVKVVKGKIKKVSIDTSGGGMVEA